MNIYNIFMFLKVNNVEFDVNILDYKTTFSTLNKEFDVNILDFLTLIFLTLGPNLLFLTHYIESSNFPLLLSCRHLLFGASD